MENKVKVLHIITRLDKGGSAENTFLTLKGLQKSRYELILMSGRVEDPLQDRSRQIQELGIRHLVLPELTRNIDIFKDIRALIKMYRLLKREKADIIHTHTSKAGFLGRIAAKLAKTPVIIHTPHGHVFFGYFSSFKTKFFIGMEMFGTRLSDKIVALTNREKNDYITYRVAGENKLTVIHSGIETEKFRDISEEDKQKLKKSMDFPEGAVLVGTVGRLVPVKGPEYLVRAAEKVLQKNRNIYFLFVGDGNLREELEKLARDLGVEKNVVFLGWRDDVSGIFSILDIFVLPSLNEGMGRVLAEAMIMGKPIVASDVGGIPDLVIHGKNGLLVPPENAEELAKNIQTLIENEGLRTMLAQEGKEMAREFSMERMVEKIHQLYESLLNMRKSV